VEETGDVLVLPIRMSSFVLPPMSALALDLQSDILLSKFLLENFENGAGGSAAT
jgi:hypothetical protein